MHIQIAPTISFKRRLIWMGFSDGKSSSEIDVGQRIIFVVSVKFPYYSNASFFGRINRGLLPNAFPTHL